MKTTFKKGDIIEFEDGECSDHYVWSPIRVLKYLDLKELAKKYNETIDKKLSSSLFCYSSFAAWMNENGYIEDCETNFVYRVWLGSYCCISKDILEDQK